MLGAIGQAIKRPLIGLALLGVLTCFLALFIGARAKADTFVQGFAATGSPTTGTIVVLSTTKASTVQAAPPNNPSRIYGVVINADQAPVAIESQGQQVFVATNGNYNVRTSTQGGPIAVGDYISLSSTAGVGAKADATQSTVVGQALGNLNSTTTGTTKVGKYVVGLVAVSIHPGPNPDFKNGAAVPFGLSRLGNSVAGKAVSASRIYTALIIFLVATGLAAGLLWVGARGSITAIGRNPLSSQSIMASLFQVAGVAITVFIIGLIGVYLLLRI